MARKSRRNRDEGARLQTQASKGTQLLAAAAYGRISTEKHDAKELDTLQIQASMIHQYSGLHKRCCNKVKRVNIE